ncbi:zinc finger, c2h2 type domain-containing protein [Fusarium flagelliforme]|uniref:Zinc finger, c2h2 type domain-containing protein n=1 Tax=Fusarium flagelliforme TaxID=2675880 RepID=A0A395M591_9HYPO|nr:zinc finger, c2h2 type domain-containing protein [Fusarium flagelliforme]
MAESKGEPARNAALHCGTCNKDFVAQKGLYMHNSSKHPSNKDKARKKPNGSGNTKQSISCDICGKRNFGNQADLTSHRRRMHNIPFPYACERCDKTCMTKRALEWHKQTHHEFVRYPIYKVEGQCEGVGPSMPVCLDYSIASGVSLLVHPFFDRTCQHHDCDEFYENSEERRQHEISVHNRCHNCTGYFSSAAELKEHQSKTMMITGEERTAGDLGRLERFIRQKEKEAVSAELTSPEIFKEEQTEDIPKDKGTETQQDAGEPSKDHPLHCRACNKTFGSTRGFNVHQRTNHNKNTSQKNERLARQDFAMSCHVCGQKRFCTQDALDQHQRQKHQMYIPTNKPEEEGESGIWEDLDDFACIGEKFDCYRQFHTASEMMRHVESGKCVAYSGEEIAAAFMDDLMDYDYRKFYNRKKKCFTCPECKGSRFKDLTALLLHAEGDSCSLDTSEGDLHDALDEIPTVCMGGEYFDSDSDGFYRNGDPWENGFRGHSHFQYEFDVEEMESYGYYG